MLSFYLFMIEAEEDSIKFEKLYSDYENMVYTIAFRITNDEIMAKDASQNAFISIARNIKRIKTDNIYMLKAYISTIAENAAIDQLRRKMREDVICSIDDYLELSDDIDIVAELEVGERVTKIREFIRKMPRRYNEVLVLRYLFDHSLCDMVHELGRKASTIQKQLTRGKHMIEEFLKEQGIK